jgi:hypothetical protein
MSLCLNSNNESLAGICQLSAHYCTGCIESAKRVSDGMIASRDEKLAKLRTDLAAANFENNELRALLDKEGMTRAGVQGELMAVNRLISEMIEFAKKNCCNPECGDVGHDLEKMQTEKPKSDGDGHVHVYQNYQCERCGKGQETEKRSVSTPNEKPFTREMFEALRDLPHPPELDKPNPKDAGL